MNQTSFSQLLTCWILPPQLSCCVADAGLCVCMAVWLSDYVAVRLCGCVADAWLCVFVTMWLCGCVANAGLCVCVVVWLCDYVAVWLCGCVAVWLWGWRRTVCLCGQRSLLALSIPTSVVHGKATMCLLNLYFLLASKTIAILYTGLGARTFWPFSVDDTIAEDFYTSEWCKTTFGPDVSK